ncbi:WD repeat-containing protein 75 [Microcaecilia unicolor]|uniref:WD repeat-containing protein 75 n=1 Tax=Microcaecilia unicolor TaxID=1415580 RepID=A0A6P7YQP9_9AMPH|nr:WD repeat-containing protein 75 [Microcaecilia unicolor]
MVATAAEIRLLRCGGSRLGYRRPVFSAPSKYLLCVSGDFVKVYRTATEECVHLLQGHSNVVTGIQLNPGNHLQLYSCSVDGSIKLWDFMDGILIKTFLVGWRFLALYTSAAVQDSVFAIIPKNNSEASDTFQLVSVKLPKTTEQEVETKDLSVILEDVSQLPKCTAFGRDGEFVASVKGLHLSVYFFKKKEICRFSLSATGKKGTNNIFTCVACHPREDCIATGHKDGRIRLWRNFHHKRDYTYSSLHWHSDEVMDLAFSAEGTCLLSGGVESVLVQWRHGSESKREFLPRLGSTIEYIATSPDGALYSTSHIDNKITIIKVNLTVSAVIQGLVKGNDIKTGLLVDPQTKALVLNGKPGHLQFYSLHSDKQLYNLDIVQQEYIHQSGLKQVELVKAAFSKAGTWLATVEEYQEKEAELELQLKFWSYDEKIQSFLLNTIINMPHEDRITSLCFQHLDASENATPTLVTASKDGRFKVWLLRDDSDIYRQSTCWNCDFVGSYHSYQATNCCFSEDGSLLAVSFQETITVWESDTWDLKCTFCQPPRKIRDLCFGRLSCSKYLLGTTDDRFLCCWNLLTCELEWSASLNVIILQPDPLSEYIAAISWLTEGSNLFVFKPDEPRPSYVQKNICRGKVMWAVFVPRDVPESLSSEKQQWLNRSQLYFLTETQDLMTFSTQTTEERLASLSKQLAVEESLPVTPFYLLLGKHRQQQKEALNTDLGKVSANSLPAQDNLAVKELLHTPAHVLPPASSLCSIFINSLLTPKESKSMEEGSSEVEMASDSEKEDSEEEMESAHIIKEITNPNCTLDEIFPMLSKSQEKELKRIRKTDYSWFSAL